MKYIVCLKWVLLALFFVVPSIMATPLGDKTFVLHAGIYPPFVQKDNNGSTDIIVQEIFEASGVAVEVLHFPLKRLGTHSLGNTNQLGVYAPISLGLAYANEDELLISKPFQVGQFLFWYYKPNLKENIEWQQLSDLKGYRIATPLGSLLTPKLREAGLQVDFASDTHAHIRKLVRNRADLSPLFYLTAHNTILKYYPEKLHDFGYLKKPIAFTQYALILNKGHHQAKEVMKYFHTGLKEIVRNGKYLKILEALYGKDSIPKEYQELIFKKLNFMPDIHYK